MFNSLILSINDSQQWSGNNHLWKLKNVDFKNVTFFSREREFMLNQVGVGQTKIFISSKVGLSSEESI